MNNSIYGRTMMNTIEICSVRIREDKRRLCQIQNEQYNRTHHKRVRQYGIHFAPEKNDNIEQSNSNGAAVLGISKWAILDFWYKLKEIFDDNLRLIQTDTDSLIFILYSHIV